MTMHRKGFSLFTPLVGTTLIVLAVLTASMLSQNDLRTSRALAGSSAVVREYVSAKQVRAGIDLTMIQGIESKTHEFLAPSSRWLNVECDNADDCKIRLEQEFVSLSSGSISNWEAIASEGLFTSFQRNIQIAAGTITGLKLPDTTELDSAARNPDSLKAYWKNERPCIQVNKTYWDNAENSTGDPFVIEYPILENDRMKVRVTPSSSWEYCIPGDVEYWIEKSLQAFDAMKDSSKDPDVDCTGWADKGFKYIERTCSTSTSNPVCGIVAVWSLDTGEEVILTLKPPGLPSTLTSTKYFCEESNGKYKLMAS